MAIKITIFCIFSVALITDRNVFAEPTVHQGYNNNPKYCEIAVRYAEQRLKIPDRLLSAISKTESGRWHPSQQVNIAWPWTVRAKGKGKFFNTKIEALAEVEILLTEGTENIDVGCMQINLKYHGAFFKTLAEIIDPNTNALYGAKYLRQLYEKTKSWTTAVGHYHSSMPKLAALYRTKVLGVWRAASVFQIPSEGIATGKKDTFKTQAITKLVNTQYSAIDYRLSDKLSMAFRARRYQPPEGTTALQQIRRRQLNAWRYQKDGRISLMHLAKMLRAEQSLHQQQKMASTSSEEREKEFTKRRKNQLAKWRAGNSMLPANSNPSLK